MLLDTVYLINLNNKHHSKKIFCDSHMWVKQITLIGSGVANFFPDGWVAHPEGQNEDKTEGSLIYMKQLLKFEKKNDESGTLAHPGMWVCLCPMSTGCSPGGVTFI